MYTDTLGTLARTIGEENFKPLAPECMAIGIVSGIIDRVFTCICLFVCVCVCVCVQALLQAEDPDLRRSVLVYTFAFNLLVTEYIQPQGTVCWHLYHVC